MAYTFLDLCEETLLYIKQPLTAKEIWEKGLELHFAEKVGTNGKTPWATIGAQLYTDIKDNKNTRFIQVSKTPAKFYLKDLSSEINIDNIQLETQPEVKVSRSTFHERDLHALLVKFVYSHPHFKCYVKTIYHENSAKRQKGYNEWLHPDLVGIYFPFEDYLDKTLKLQESFKVSSFKLFSFEMKIKLTFTNLREYYFQAVSNSTWAHEGYLVALEVDEDPVFRDELRRLNNSFGIGIIQLNAANIEQSEIIMPAKEKEVVDWDTIDRLAAQNRDFNDFISDLTEDIKVGKVKSNYDKVLKDEEYERYIEDMILL